MDKERSLKPYWYPMADGEQNEILPSLHKNVLRPDIITKALDYIVKLICFIILYFVLRMMYNLFYFVMKQTSINPEFQVYISAAIVAGIFIIGVWIWYLRRPYPVYLVSFATSIPDDKYKVSTEEFVKIIEGAGSFEQEQLDFQKKLASRTGLGEETYLPEALHRIPITVSMADAREEVNIVMKLACDQLFAQTGIDPTKDIDIVITNCSLFNPTPSMSAMLINMYKLKTTVKNYTLSGMGCSAGLVSIDLAKDLLQTYPNINILVFSTENLTKNYYPGKVKGMLISNTLFRMGGAAILLSNKRSWRNKAKFECVDTQRIHHGKYDDSYNAVFQYEDDEGIVGVKIGRELLKCVTRALTQNLNLLMPRVISYKEMIKFIIFFIKQKLGKIDSKEIFMPNFRETFQAFCIHAGGRAIVDGLQENLKLTDEDCMPSRATLYRFGNTSSSSVWYEMKFIERIDTLKKGDKVWQLAFGSGLKCNSVVWRKLN
ncbi:3-ketoacyl-CoA synthase, putative [Entamoeba histolytica HM-3:IMSS]|uniref:3-ketoacyl-CoA synthase n=1 Tax=Entamoeba histolytica HM-3:IMSS TaxID=885315 RepID=M7WID1_ENTHI|nr:3-ketoacyl-CoA synthase, putative [Entamoeba histolytica HM-3:IMSS]